MSLPYSIRSLGALSRDPAVYLSIKRSGEALLFDLGDLSSLSHREILRARHVFISHTHMDHFMDFDRLLRVNVPHKKRLYLYGPKGLAQQVAYKLKAYTWNLIDQDQLDFSVTEWWAKEKRLHIYAVAKRNNFQVELTESRIETAAPELVRLSDGSRVQALALDHKGIESLSFRISSPVSSKVDIDRLKQEGLKPGPWISRLQTDYAADLLDGNVQVNGQTFDKRTLAALILDERPSFSWIYLTDIGFDKPNLSKLKSYFAPATALLSECSFEARERQRAKAKAHLTSMQAALIAVSLQVEELQLFHVSNLYAGQEKSVADEALAFFQHFRRLEPREFDQQVDEEFVLIEQCES